MRSTQSVEIRSLAKSNEALHVGQNGYAKRLGSAKAKRLCKVVSNSAVENNFALCVSFALMGAKGVIEIASWSINWQKLCGLCILMAACTVYRWWFKVLIELVLAKHSAALRSGRQLEIKDVQGQSGFLGQQFRTPRSSNGYAHHPETWRAAAL